MPEPIPPPAQKPDDPETVSIDIEKLSDSELGALVRKELDRTKVRFLKAFYAKVSGRWKLHHTLVSEP